MIYNIEMKSSLFPKIRLLFFNLTLLRSFAKNLFKCINSFSQLLRPGGTKFWVGDWLSAFLRDTNIHDFLFRCSAKKVGGFPCSAGPVILQYLWPSKKLLMEVNYATFLDQANKFYCCFSTFRNQIKDMAKE